MDCCSNKALVLYRAFDIVIFHCLARWVEFSNFTYNTYNVTSETDYIIWSHGFCENMVDISIGKQCLNVNFEHRSIYLSIP